jgi:apolipoprotein N-acyltransferase
MTVAAVQGGGVRGLRAVDADPAGLFQAHVDASSLVTTPVDLVVWPEDVIDLDHELDGSPEDGVLADLARRLQTTLVAGIVEDVDFSHFRNAAVVYSPNGTVIGRYDKVHRVPFGEYVPGRGLIEHLVNLNAIPRDAIPGHGPGFVQTPAGPLGVLISYEVFFADRARAAVRAGGDVLLVPTNASSYQSSQVPTQELAAARLRAIETGRDVVQAGPTGYSALIDSRGHVITRSTLGHRAVEEGTVERRHGQTPYTRAGDLPVEALALVILAVSWWRTRRMGVDRTG